MRVKLGDLLSIIVLFLAGVLLIGVIYIFKPPIRLLLVVSAAIFLLVVLIIAGARSRAY